MTMAGFYSNKCLHILIFMTRIHRLQFLAVSVIPKIVVFLNLMTQDPLIFKPEQKSKYKIQKGVKEFIKHGREMKKKKPEDFRFIHLVVETLPMSSIFDSLMLSWLTPNFPDQNSNE